MNDDEFEKKLHTLTGALHRPDPTPAWKAEILARARREAAAIPFKRTLPPRSLMFGWAAAWVAILVMDFTAPSNPAPETNLFVGVPASKPEPKGVPPADSTAPTLFAFHQRMNLNLDLPQ